MSYYDSILTGCAVDLYRAIMCTHVTDERQIQQPNRHDSAYYESAGIVVLRHGDNILMTFGVGEDGELTVVENPGQDRCVCCGGLFDRCDLEQIRGTDEDVLYCFDCMLALCPEWPDLEDAALDREDYTGECAKCGAVCCLQGIDPGLLSASDRVFCEDCSQEDYRSGEQGEAVQECVVRQPRQ